VPLIGLSALGHPQSGVLAAQGGFAGFYAAGEPHRRRAVVLAIGAALVTAMALGTLVAPTAWLTALTGALVAAAAAFACLAYAVGPPREYFIVFTFLIAGGLPQDPAAVWSRAGLVALGAAIALMIALTRRRGGTAEEQAVAAVADLLRAIGTPRAQHAQRRADAAVRAVPLQLRLERVLEAAHGLVIEESPPLHPAWPEVVATGRSARDLPLPPVPAGERLARAWASVPDEQDPLPRRPWFAPLRDALHPHSVIVGSALRMGVTVGVAGALGLAIGGAHGYWLPLSAAAVLQATNVTLARRRAIQRATGTFVGVFLAGALLATHPGTSALIAIVVVLQFVTELVIVASYGVAVVFITGLALLMLQLAHPESGIDLLGARVLDTLAGCALGALGGALLWRDRAARRLPAARAEVVRASGKAIGAALKDTTGLRHARHAVAAALSDLNALERDAGEPPTQAVERLAYVALSLPRDARLTARVAETPRPAARRSRLPAEPAGAGPCPEADRLERAIGALAEAIEAGDPPPASMPTLEGLPRTTAALEDLRRWAASSPATGRPSRPA